MTKKALWLLVIPLALGCQTAGGGSTSVDRSEPSLREDPGMPDPPRSTPSTKPSEFRLNSIYFDFDDSTLRSDAKSQLREAAKALRDQSKLRIEVQGHCDERGAEEYNLALGQRRAQSAKRYLVDLGIRSSRIETKTFGETLPAVRGHDESAWARNRRDEFVVVR